MKAVRFDEYGGIDVLKVVDVPRPVPMAGQVLVRVKAAGINPGEAKIRVGLEDSTWPATFPSGEGSDLAGIVSRTGPGVTSFSAGDEVIGWTDNRASHAEYVAVEEQHLTAKPAGVPWEEAGALFVAGSTAYAAVRAVGLTGGDTVAVSGAAGGVGSIAVQLARQAGATVIGVASGAHHPWLAAHGVIPAAYGDGMADRIRRAASKVDAFIDTFGAGYVQLALELGVEPSRIDTIVKLRGRRTVRGQRRWQRGRVHRERARRTRGPDRGRRAGAAHRGDVPARRGSGRLPATRGGPRSRQDRLAALGDGVSQHDPRTHRRIARMAPALSPGPSWPVRDMPSPA
jgi:NADPH:quinone reductase-like Zn-dependent oxidoreductase